MATEILILAAALVSHGVWVHLSMRQLRRDLLKVAKNPRQARNALLESKSYSRLEK